MCEGQRVRLVAEPISPDETGVLKLIKEKLLTHLTRSKTVTRLPTGDRRHVPSGVNMRFPLQ